MTKRVCVYCASSDQIDDIYQEQTVLLGTYLGQKGWNVINGAGNKGLMNTLTNAVVASGGTATGVIPQFMVDKGLLHPNLTEVIVTDTMHERKKTMADLSDAVIALPGGYGTMEELLEIITWKQLGLYHKPIIVFDILAFYDDLFTFITRALAKNFIRQEHVHLCHRAENLEAVIQLLAGNIT
jgi:uncharacterized protein (TIGR00730 family)